MNSLLTVSTSLPHDNDVLAVVAIAPKKDLALITVLLEIVAPQTACDPMSEQTWLNCRLSDIRQKRCAD